MRSFANAKPYMNTNEFSASDISKYENKVRFYLIQRQKIGLKSGDFLDLKAYEPGMRHLIDNYIVASDSETIGEFNDLTLLDFVKEQGKVLSSGDESKSSKESAAEAIENNIRRKIVEKIIINPKYYNKMSLILEDLIEERRKGIKSYREFLIKCINLVKNIENPESNIDYPENIRKSEGLMALYDNTGCDEKLAVKLHNAVLNSAEKGFRTDEAKMEMVKESIDNIINDDDEVERIYKIIESQEEY